MNFLQRLVARGAWMRVVATFGLVVCGAAGTYFTMRPIASGAAEPALTLDWQMHDRFGVDRDGDAVVDDPMGGGIISLPSTAQPAPSEAVKEAQAYVKPSSWAVTLSVCDATLSEQHPDWTYAWKVAGPSGRTITPTPNDCRLQQVDLPVLGTWNVTVALKNASAVTQTTKTFPITPRDEFIVAMGDSIASGEGNPDLIMHQQPTWATSTFTWSPIWQERQCHRSALSGQAQAAMRMERRDPHSTITFVHLGCSGAGIMQGILDKYEGIQELGGTAGPKKVPQLDTAKFLADYAGRRPDLVVISIGANDVKFGNIVENCIVATGCNLDKTEDGPETGKSLFDGAKNQINPCAGGTTPTWTPGASYPTCGRYELLDAELKKRDLVPRVNGTPDASRVLFTQYFDPSVAKPDRTPCAGDDRPDVDVGIAGIGITQAEWTWAGKDVVDVLNGSVQAATQRHGWTFVDGIAPQFYGHGYCVRGDRWTRLLQESITFMGGDIHGAFHPNAEGHLRTYGLGIEAKAVPKLDIGGATAPVDSALLAGPLSAGLPSLLTLYDSLDFDLDQLLTEQHTPWGALKTKFSELRAEALKGMSSLAAKSGAFCLGKPGATLNELVSRLEDPDCNGDPTKDFSIPGVADIDLAGDIEPKHLSTVYTVKLKVKATRAEDYAFTLARLQDAAGPALSAAASSLDPNAKSQVLFEHEFKFRIEIKLPNRRDKKPGTGNSDDKPRIDLNSLGTADLKFDSGVEFGTSTNAALADLPAMNTSVGPFSATVTGPAKLALHFKANPKVPLAPIDKNGDNYLSLSELAGITTTNVSAHWIDCVQFSPDMNLTIKPKLYNQTFANSFSGTATLAGDLCGNQKLEPNFMLNGLASFDDLTPTDVIRAIGELARALRTLKQHGDLQLPFLGEKDLANIVEVADSVTDALEKNGKEDDPKLVSKRDTLEEIFDALEAAGMPPNVLTTLRNSLQYNAVTQQLTFQLRDAKTYGGSTAKSLKGALDVGHLLADAGLDRLVTGTAVAAADVRAGYQLHADVGIDLQGTEKSALDRVYIVPSATPVLTVDAKVGGNFDATGRLGSFRARVMNDDDDNGQPDRAEVLHKCGDRTQPAQIKVLLQSGATPGRLTVSELADFAGSEATLAADACGKLAVRAAAVYGSTPERELADARLTAAFAWQKPSGEPDITVNLGAGYDKSLLRLGEWGDAPTPKRVLEVTRDVTCAISDSLAGATSNESLPIVGSSPVQVADGFEKACTKLTELLTLDVPQIVEDAEQKVEEAIGNALDVQPADRSKLVDLGFSSASGSAGALLDIKLQLGVCSAGPNAQPTNSQCTIQLPALTNRRLSLPPSDGVPALRGALGDVKVGWSAFGTLHFGLELPAVTGGLGTFSANAPVLSVVDDTGLSFGVGASINGSIDATLGPYAVKANAAANAGIGVALGPDLAPAGPSRETFDDWLAAITGPDALHIERRMTCGENVNSPQPPNATLNGTPAFASGHIALSLNNTLLGTPAFCAPDLDPTTWGATDGGLNANLQNQRIQWALLSDGARWILKKISESLVLPADAQIPLLGGDPVANANVSDALTKVREGLDGIVDDLDDLNANGGTAAVLQVKLQSALSAALPASMRTAAPQIILTCDPSCNGKSILAVRGAEIRLRLGNTGEQTTTPMASGYGGMPILTDQKLSAKAAWHLDLAFGLDPDGFYLRTDNPLTPGLPELGADINVTIPSPMTGHMFGVPIKITDGDPSAPDAYVGAGIDLVGGTNGKLRFSELQASNFTPSVHACVNAVTTVEAGPDSTAPAQLASLPRLSFTLEIAGGWNCNSGDWAKFGNPPTGGLGGRIRLLDAQVYMGEWARRTLGPQVTAALDRVGPIADLAAKLSEPIPGVPDLEAKLGRQLPPGIPRTYRDAIEAICDPTHTGRCNFALVDILATLSQIRQLTAHVADTGVISLGDITVALDGARNVVSDASTILQYTKDPAALRQAFEDFKNSVQDPSFKQIFERLTIQEPKKNGVEGYWGIELPVWENPASLINLLFGQDVRLIEVRAGISASFHAASPIPIVPPFALVPALDAQLNARIAIGYDTKGIRDVIQQAHDADPKNDSFIGKAEALLGGLYLDDYAPGGVDVKEVDATVTGSLGIGIPPVLLRAKLIGQASLDFRNTLHTPKDSGIIRLPTLVKQIGRNPLCAFEFQASLAAGVDLAIGDWATFDLVKPWTFWQINPLPPNSCTSVQATSNVAGLVKRGDWAVLDRRSSSDAAPDRVVARLSYGSSSVRLGNAEAPLSGVNNMLILLGPGDDAALVERAGAYGHVIVCGGDGNDTIVGTIGGRDEIYGDTTVNTWSLPGATYNCTGASPGNDALYGRGGFPGDPSDPGGDRLGGGPGNDKLSAFAPADSEMTSWFPGAQYSSGFGITDGGEFFGGAGDDTISTDERTSVDGGDGTDTVRTSGGAPGLATARTRYDLGAGQWCPLNPPAGVSDADATDLTAWTCAGAPWSLLATERLTTGAGRDDVRGTSAAEVFDTGAGNDLVLSGGGDDNVKTGIGNDTADAAAGNDSVFGGDGNDFLIAGAGNDVVRGHAGADTITGNDGNDTIDGGNGSNGPPDTADGADLIDGGRHNDAIDGGPGNDTLMGGSGTDTVLGGSGDDRLRNPFVDSGVIIGGRATQACGDCGDKYDGGTGRDTVDYSESTVPFTPPNGVRVTVDGVANDGRAAFDTIVNGIRLHVAADDGSDNVTATIENIVGTPFADNITGGSAANRIEGAGGNDVLAGGDGNDVVLGGEGDDRLAGDNGNDRLESGPGTSNNRTDGADSVLDGGAGNDTLLGGSGDDVLRGGSGRDGLFHIASPDDGFVNPATVQYAGRNVLDGGTGPDRVEGAFDGHDTITYEGRTDPISVSVDRSFSTIDADGGAADADPATGAPADEPGNYIDSYRGGDGADFLNICDSATTVFGGKGSDTLLGCNPSIALSGGTGADLLGGNATATYASSSHAVTVTLDGVANDGEPAEGDNVRTSFVIGSRFADAITGGPANDVLRGGDGSDTIRGLAGTDWIDGGLATDSLSGGSGVDSLSYVDAPRGITFSPADGIANDGVPGEPDNIKPDFERVLGSQFADVFVLGNGNDWVDAGLGDDVLSGGIGNDELHGGPGSDTIDGGLGADLLDGGSGGNDTVTYASRTSGVHVTPTPGSDGDDGEPGEGDSAFLFSTIVGGAGNDTIEGGTSHFVSIPGAPVFSWVHPDATISGGGGDDTLRAFTSIDFGITISGGDGNDTVSGSDRNDHLFGGNGNDTIAAGQGDDDLHGESGDDVLGGGGGKDAFDGGSGRTTITYGDIGPEAGIRVTLDDVANDGELTRRVKRLKSDPSISDAFAPGDFLCATPVVAGAACDAAWDYGEVNPDTLENVPSDTAELWGSRAGDYLRARTCTGAQCPSPSLVPGSVLRGEPPENRDAGTGLIDNMNDVLVGGPYGTASQPTILDPGVPLRYSLVPLGEPLPQPDEPDLVEGGTGYERVDYSWWTSDIEWIAASRASLCLDLAPLRPDPYVEEPVRSRAATGCAPDPTSPEHAIAALRSLGGIDELVGGATHDLLFGTEGADRLVGGGGNDYLEGRDGADVLVGCSGNDVFYGGDRRDGADAFVEAQIGVCNANGNDRVTYVDRVDPVTTTNNNVADDGENGEGDNISSDIETMTPPAALAAGSPNLVTAISPHRAGTSAVIDLVITNPGQRPATEVVVTATFRGGVALLEALGPRCGVASHTEIRCRFARIDPGSTYKAELNLGDATAFDSFSLRATATSREPDQFMPDNSASGIVVSERYIDAGDRESSVAVYAPGFLPGNGATTTLAYLTAGPNDLDVTADVGTVDDDRWAVATVIIGDDGLKENDEFADVTVRSVPVGRATFTARLWIIDDDTP